MRASLSLSTLHSLLNLIMKMKKVTVRGADSAQAESSSGGVGDTGDWRVDCEERDRAVKL